MDVEKVIATPLWVQDLLRDNRISTPNALDAKLRPDKKKIRADGAGISTSGLLARYGRGDSAPSRSKRDWLFEESQYNFEMLDHWLWDQLRNREMGRDERFEIQVGVDSFLCSRLFGPRSPGRVAYTLRPVTSIKRRQLAAQGDEYALSALITLLDEEVEAAKPWPDSDDRESRLEEERAEAQVLLLGEAICQCLVFLISDHRFKPARTALVARVRQRVLDPITTRRGGFATAHYDFIGLAEEVELLRAKSPTPRDFQWSPTAQRKFHLALMEGKIDGDLTSRLRVPRRLPDSTIEDSLRRAPCIQRPIRLELPPTSDHRQANRDYGKDARRILREGLREYWVDI